jgi:hypothetical protein
MAEDFGERRAGIGRDLGGYDADATMAALLEEF